MNNTNTVKMCAKGIDNVARCAHTGYMKVSDTVDNNVRDSEKEDVRMVKQTSESLGPCSCTYEMCSCRGECSLPAVNLVAFGSGEDYVDYEELCAECRDDALRSFDFAHIITTKKVKE